MSDAQIAGLVTFIGSLVSFALGYSGGFNFGKNAGFKSGYSRGWGEAKDLYK